MSAELQRATPIDTLHRQTSMETVSTHVTRIASKFHFNNQFSDNGQIRLLDQFSLTCDKHERLRAL